MNSFFGIRIATYKRNNGTYHLLGRCLKSILSQTFTNWKVFLIGDHYEPHQEFLEIASMIPNVKLYQHNLSESPERSKYSGNKLWKVAGYTASCLGLQKIKDENIPICVCMDDDDYWTKDHLQTLWEAYQSFPDAAFVYTQSTYRTKVLPNVQVGLHYNNKPPQPYEIIHSAASWNVQKIPLIYRNINEEHSIWSAGDADMWDRIRRYCEQNNLKTLYVPKLTVRHEGEHGEFIVPPML